MGEEPTMAKSEKIDGIDKWEVESAARTLMESIKIRKNPKLFAAAKKEATRQAKLAQAAALEKKVDAKLVQTFGNPHSKKKGY